jgi:hypothetical protein
MSRVAVPSEKVASGKRFYGKYRGTVINNIDPKGLGRILVQVPDVSMLMPSSWALPCLPWGGMQAGMFVVPLMGAGVWVEFEQGDPDFPIWSGCFFGSPLDVPPAAKLAMPPIPGFTLQTPLKNLLQVSDLPGPTGGIQLRTTTGAMISITDLGITITNGKGATITMLGNTVDVNGGALTII